MAPRWVAEHLTYNQDHETLQNIIVYPEGHNKEEVKQECTHQNRSLLIPDGDLYRFRD